MRFVRAPVGRFLEEERSAGRTAERIVANPPRAGLGRAVV
ncbi:MAG: hypothetical protein GWN73_22360, partial [Actinobacteria bacterium]|nr:hypothetical protein [Actinomycetota bacterium]NIS33078.1 hypothetical protein [Actinomycetota bacterium]NIU68005.1 hypothetical protein [Actinomycetota bacterium]NIW29792.1 hypothetical protein [Actinomycetota bacterium]